VTIDEPGDINPGDIYEDCAFHPVLCTRNDGGVLMGISLIDATTPRTCDLKHCGVIRLSIDDVIAARADWPGYLARREAGPEPGRGLGKQGMSSTEGRSCVLTTARPRR
jgi:hypothetical protein